MYPEMLHWSPKGELSRVRIKQGRNFPVCLKKKGNDETRPSLVPPQELDSVVAENKSSSAFSHTTCWWYLLLPASHLGYLQEPLFRLCCTAEHTVFNRDSLWSPNRYFLDIWTLSRFPLASVTTYLLFLERFHFCFSSHLKNAILMANTTDTSTLKFSGVKAMGIKLISLLQQLASVQNDLLAILLHSCFFWYWQLHAPHLSLNNIPLGTDTPK